MSVESQPQRETHHIRIGGASGNIQVEKGRRKVLEARDSRAEILEIKRKLSRRNHGGRTAVGLKIA